MADFPSLIVKFTIAYENFRTYEIYFIGWILQTFIQALNGCN